MESIFVCLLLVFLLGISCTAQEPQLKRERRFLIVPPTSPTRHQLISGIGIPLDLEDEAVTLGIVLKAQYFLPENADQLKPIYYPGIFDNFTPVNYEKQNDTRASRWLVYDGFAKLLDTKGFNGRACVLRGICESAETKFTHHSGLFGELLHIVFTPSTTTDPITTPAHHDYVEAEQLGKRDEACSEIFNQCKKSVLDIFTQVYDSQLFHFD
ncbi:unnamed protein product [Diamesa hyperborea]